MTFDLPVYEAVLLKRYKRFLADVRFPDGRETTVHCPNSGAMMGVAPPGARCWVTDSGNTKRKHPMTLEIVEADDTLVGVNTQAPNRITAEALAADAIPELTGYDSHRREVRYHDNSRVDFLLEADGRPPAYVEVKNVHLRRSPDLAEFPDSITARGAKHLEALGDMVEDGARAVQLFIIQRSDCAQFRLAADIDEAYAITLSRAQQRGVEVLAYDCKVTPKEIKIRQQLKIEAL